MAPSGHLSAALGLAIVAMAHGIEGNGASGFPSRLEEYLTKNVAITAGERKSLLAGAPVTKLLDVDEGKEVGVFGAVWIDAPAQRYVDAVNDIEHFERGGGFKVTKRISSPPTIEDFADLHLPDGDLKDLRTCRVGDCVVKLDEQAIRTLRAEVDWKAPGARAAADGVMQRFALRHVNGYLEGGNERLAVYRDHSRPTSAAEEFRALIDRIPELQAYLPSLRRYLLEYPAPADPEPASLLYWQQTEFGARPTIRISHLTIWQTPEGTAVASKMLYASHYFLAGFELRALVPDPSRGRGFWFVTLNRSRSDGLSGFTGRIIRGRVRSEVQKGMLAGLRATKRLLEAPAGG
jgi:hypothetical protein